MHLQDPIDPCALASFIKMFPGEVESETPIIASYQGESFLCFDVLTNPHSIWVQWLYVPREKRGKGAMRRLVHELIRTSERTFCPVNLYPREFAFLAWNPKDWLSTLDSQEHQLEDGAPSWEQLDKIYRRHGFEVALEITNTAKAIELGRLMLVYRPKTKRPKPVPTIRDLQRLYRRELSLERFLERYGDSSAN